LGSNGALRLAEIAPRDAFRLPGILRRFVLHTALFHAQCGGWTNQHQWQQGGCEYSNRLAENSSFAHEINSEMNDETAVIP
jgi:hypothetical protein